MVFFVIGNFTYVSNKIKISFPPPTPQALLYTHNISPSNFMPAAPALLAPPPPSFPPLPPLSYKQLSQTMLYWMYTGVGHPWEPEKPRSQNLLEKECASFLLKLSVATNSSVTGGGARRVPHASMPRSLHLGQRVCLT